MGVVEVGQVAFFNFNLWTRWELASQQPPFFATCFQWAKSKWGCYGLGKKHTGNQLSVKVYTSNVSARWKYFSWLFPPLGYNVFDGVIRVETALRRLLWRSCFSRFFWGLHAVNLKNERHWLQSTKNESLCTCRKVRTATSKKNLPFKTKITLGVYPLIFWK